MKRKLFLILPAIAIASFAFRQVSTSKLTVEVDNIKDISGKNISIGVFEKNTFPTIGKAKYEKSVIANGSKVSLSFDLPKGDYAVAIYHDLNANKSLDKNLFGIPKEPYGFSKNFKPKMSPPDFSDCSFTLTETAKTISISLIQ